MKLNREALKGALAFLTGQTGSRRQVMPILSSVLFAGDGQGRMRLVMTSLEVTASVTFREKPPKRPFCTEALRLQRALSLFASERVEVLLEDGLVQVKADSPKAVYSAPVFPAGDFPTQSSKMWSPVFRLDPAQEEAQVFSVLAKGQSRESFEEKFRYAMAFPPFEDAPGEATATFVSASGPAVVRLDACGLGRCEKPLKIDAVRLLPLMKIGPVQIQASDGFMAAQAEDADNIYRTEISLSSDEIPPLDQLYYKDYRDEITCKREDLLRAVSLAKLSAGEIGTASMYFDGSVLEIAAESALESLTCWQSVDAEALIEGAPDRRVCFGADLMIKLLGGFSSDEVTLRFRIADSGDYARSIELTDSRVRCHLQARVPTHVAEAEGAAPVPSA